MLRAVVRAQQPIMSAATPLGLCHMRHTTDALHLTPGSSFSSATRFSFTDSAWLVRCLLIRTPFSILWLMVLLLGCASSSKEPISFSCPTGWTVEHAKILGGLHSYTVSAVTVEDGSLEILQHWPDGRGEQATKSSATSSGPWMNDRFAGENCQGSYATFENGTNRLLVIFMMTSDGTLWSGRFAGTSNGWDKALILLKSFKRDGS